MANPNAPNGFVPVRHASNAAGNPDVYATGTNARVIVKIMKHELLGVATTEV
jgi:hypothetical protein